MKLFMVGPGGAIQRHMYYLIAYTHVRNKFKSTCLQLQLNGHCNHRPAGLPLRLPIHDVFKGKHGGLSVGGKLESGAVKVGSKVMVMPSHEVGTVKTLEVDGKVSHGGGIQQELHQWSRVKELCELTPARCRMISGKKGYIVLLGLDSQTPCVT